jgi:hypothetical protein
MIRGVRRESTPLYSRGGREGERIMKRYILCFECGHKPYLLTAVISDCGHTPTWPDRKSAREAAQRLGITGAFPVKLRRSMRPHRQAPWTVQMEFTVAAVEAAARIGAPVPMKPVDPGVEWGPRHDVP